MPFCAFVTYIKNRATNGKLNIEAYLKGSNCAYLGIKEEDQKYIMSQI